MELQSACRTYFRHAMLQSAVPNPSRPQGAQDVQQPAVLTSVFSLSALAVSFSLCSKFNTAT